MTAYFATCDAVGTVRGLIQSPDSIAIRQGPADETGLIARIDLETHQQIANDLHGWRLWGGEIIRRQTMPASISGATIAADGEAAIVISGIPPNSKLTLTGAITLGPVDVTGDTLTLTSTQPGFIDVALDCVPLYRPWKTTIHAT